VVEGNARLQGAALRAHDDHRIAMALAVAALGASGSTELEGSECVAVSFPGFFSVLERAAGRA
jgi:3-phosphoshikimate 1-carboxyvinyltransferase